MKIIAHRGDSASLPENTPESWSAAYDNGAYAIEADVRLSQDGVCICAHDADLRRLFDRPERPEDLPFDALIALKGTDGCRIVGLAEVLQHARNNRAVLLDIKDESPSALVSIAKSIKETVPLERRRQVIAGCHTLDAVTFFAGLGQTQILGFIPEPDEANAFFEAGAPLIRLWERDVTADRVAQLHALGAETWVTTGGYGTPLRTGDATPDTIAALASAGVSGVLVNDVAGTQTMLEALS